MNNRKLPTIEDEMVVSRILNIRGVKVIIDMDLAELYGVSTKRLNEQVKRNIARFPQDFMFQLTEEEKRSVIETYDHLSRLKFSSNRPFVFTEHGAVMLASVLNSTRAVLVNVQIVRIFVQMREAILVHKDILVKLEKLERRAEGYDSDLRLIFEHLRELLTPTTRPLRAIGFKRKDE